MMEEGKCEMWDTYLLKLWHWQRKLEENVYVFNNNDLDLHLTELFRIKEV